jgi:hypothetical protein
VVGGPGVAAGGAADELVGGGEEGRRHRCDGGSGS